ncbi:MAG: SRPBCC family protein [Actinobacteria bacterium]|nr:SRPBCC family protein [Actinomycetota bacterium]
MPYRSRRATRTWAHRLAAPPSQVFPLLCPVREYDWIEGWECEMVFTDSGVAEDGCVFTRTDDTGPAVWTVSRYEPDERIEFVIVTPGSHVQRLDIAVEAEPGGSRVHWRRTITSLDPAGEAAVAALEDGSWDAAMAMLERMLAHYCATGEMLRLSDR